MRYRTWKAFLSKSLLSPFIILAILIGNILIKNIDFFKEMELNYFISGGILGYGIILVVQYLVSKGKYKYLSIYGIIYFLLGITNLFIETLYKDYINYILIILYFIHGISKIFIRNTFSNKIRIVEIILGTIYICYGVLCIINIDFIINKYIAYLIILIDLFLLGFRIVNDINFIKEEIREQSIENNATLKKEKNVNLDNELNNKKSRRVLKDEVIDLERFFEGK